MDPQRNASTCFACCMLCMALGVGFDEVALLALFLTDVGSAKAAGGGRPWVVKVNWVNSPVRKVH